MGDKSHREKLYEAFSGGEGDVDERVARGLDVGASYLGLPFGFLTRVDDGTQEVVSSTGDHPLLSPGESCPIEQAYCRETVATGGPLAVQHAATSPAVSEAAFDRFDLGTYVGATVQVGDEAYGTVCFAGPEERDEGFSEAETMFVELLAKLVGQALERRDHERALRERNERLAREKRRFEGIADASFDVLFRVGPDGEFTYVSSAVERVLGYAAETLVGSQFATFVADSSFDDALGAYANVLDGEALEGLELDFRASDGDRVVLDVNATPITDEGSVVGVQGVGRDVTARKERERELRSKTRAMDGAAIGITIADGREADTPLLYANEGFERLTGYDADEMLGRNCRFLQGAATDPDAVARLGEGIAAAEPTTAELVNYRADGTPFWNEVRVDPVTDDAGDVTRYLGFQADVTERKRTEQLVRLLNRVLRHNLRNEMNVVLGLGSHLQEGFGDPAAVGERVVDTAERVVELSEHARELEHYARTERDPERLDPERVLSGVATRYRDRYPDATVDVSVETDYGICAGAELERAVAELVENALKHDPGDSTVSVTARTTARGMDDDADAGTTARAGADRDVAVDGGAWIELTVDDDGPGIAETEAAVIARGEEDALEHGSGLGLWLVNWVVTRYGGSCQVDADGEGTTVTVRLPAIDETTPVDEVARPPTVLFR